MKELVELVQKIGNEVCEGCSVDSDCGIEPHRCYRVLDSITYLKEFFKDKKNLDKLFEV